MKRIILTLVLSFLSVGANAALIDRGEGFIYDSDQDITWTQDANINGLDTWANQLAWAAGYSKTHTVYGTFDDWRLPTTLQPDPTCDLQTPGSFPIGWGDNCTGSEMGHLSNVDGIRSWSMGVFTNVQPYWYWSEPLAITISAVGIDFAGGFQDFILLGSVTYAWAVRDGDVAIPAAVDIDIRPARTTNTIHTNHDGTGGEQNDPVKVGVLGSSTLVGDPIDFAVADIDPATVRFGPAEGAPAKKPDLLATNLDNDGLDDATFEFRLASVGISCGETEATLKGETTSGQLFEGTDVISTVCNASCH